MICFNKATKTTTNYVDAQFVQVVESLPNVSVGHEAVSSTAWRILVNIETTPITFGYITIMTETTFIELSGMNKAGQRRLRRLKGTRVTFSKENLATESNFTVAVIN